jgi:hypothetical protein
MGNVSLSRYGLQKKVKSASINAQCYRCGGFTRLYVSYIHCAHNVRTCSVHCDFACGYAHIRYLNGHKDVFLVLLHRKPWSEHHVHDCWEHLRTANTSRNLHQEHRRENLPIIVELIAVGWSLCISVSRANDVIVLLHV